MEMREKRKKTRLRRLTIEMKVCLPSPFLVLEIAAHERTEGLKKKKEGLSGGGSVS